MRFCCIFKSYYLYLYKYLYMVVFSMPFNIPNSKVSAGLLFKEVIEQPPFRYLRCGSCFCSVLAKDYAIHTSLAAQVASLSWSPNSLP